MARKNPYATISDRGIGYEPPHITPSNTSPNAPVPYSNDNSYNHHHGASNAYTSMYHKNTEYNQSQNFNDPFMSEYDDTFENIPTSDDGYFPSSTYEQEDDEVAAAQWKSVQLFFCRLRLLATVHIIPIILIFCTKFWPMSAVMLTSFLLILLYWYFHQTKIKRIVVMYSIVHIINLILHIVLDLYLLASQISRLSPFYYTTFAVIVFDSILILLTLYNSFWLFRSLSVTSIQF